MNRYWIACALGVVIGAVLTTGIFHQTDGTRSWESPASAQTPRQATQASNALTSVQAPPARLQLTSEEQANVRVYEVANPSVVNINTRSYQVDPFFMVPSASEGSGSGSVIDKKGHVLTNYHVVEGEQEIIVTMANGNSYEAEIVGGDKTDDLAVLRINAPAAELHPIRFGRSGDLRVGQRVYVLGNPFGLEGTLTTGIISSLNRSLPSRAGPREMRSIIQTDAAMNPGNSGGPMLDTHGTMVGMNVAIASRTGQSAGVGFAIPVDRIRRLVPRLIQYGKVLRPELGISEVMETPDGLRIRRLRRGGPAEMSGVRGPQLRQRRYQSGNTIYTRNIVDYSSGDLLTAVNREPVQTAADLLEKIDSFQPGDVVELSVVREGSPMTIAVELGASG